MSLERIGVGLLGSGVARVFGILQWRVMVPSKLLTIWRYWYGFVVKFDGGV